jgi:DNA repair exonuclease SbcCD ATPase subunit
MRVKELEVENILSIGQLSISFQDSGLVLLDGWNHDDNSHNGAGKSSIFNALAFAIYNKLPRKITASEIVRRGCKTGFARVVLNIGKDELDIKRSRPNGLVVLKNNIPCPEISQEQLEKLINLTYDQFLICMYSSQVESVKLLTLNDGSKKDFFLRLLNLEDFAERKKHTDALIKTKNTELSELRLSLGKVEAKISAYSENLVDIDSVVNKIKELDSSELILELQSLSKIQKPDISKFDLLESNLNKKLRDIAIAESGIRNHNSLLKKLKHDMAHMRPEGAVCPHCDQYFIVDNDGAVTENQLQLEHDKCVDEIATLSQDVLEKDKIENNLLKLKSKKSELLSEYSDASIRKSELNNLIDRRSHQISLLNEKLEKQAEALSKIEDAKKLAEALSNKMSQLNTDILVYEAVSSALSPTGAPAYVVDSIIDRFNEKVSQYVSLVWPNATYMLQSYKENKTGDVKAKFSDKLMIQGVESSIGSLSGGELRCLSLAVDFAIIDVVESVFGISINPIVLDEPFEALDSLNRERVIEVLETISADRQIYVIDHATEAKSMFSSIIKIEKKNGVSSIV